MTSTEEAKQELEASPPKKVKKKLTAEEIRQRRKRQAALRRQRILAGSGQDGKGKNIRLGFVQNQASSEELKKASQIKPKSDIATTNSITNNAFTSNNNSQNSQCSNPFMDNNPNQQHIRDAFNSQPNHPFFNMSQNGLPSMDPNADINDMMQQMLGGLLGGNMSTNPQQSTSDILEKWKKDERLIQYETYSHHLFCLLFVIALVFLPYEYDIGIFGYSLSSDTWTFFITLEIILFSMFYGYKQYQCRQFNSSHPQQNNSMGMAGGPLMSMMGAGIGASLLGGGAAMSDFIQKWIERLTMLWDYVKMIRQLISDLCLVLFLWILLTAIKSFISAIITT